MTVPPVRPLLCIAAALVLAASPAVRAQPGEPSRLEARRLAESELAEGARLLAAGPEQALAALVPLERAADLASTARASDVYARARLLKARVLRQTGEPEAALQSVDEAVAVARAAREREVQLQALGEGARLATELGRGREALLRWRETVLVLGELGRDEERAVALLELAEAAAAVGDREQARASTSEAAATFRRLGRPALVRQARERRAEWETAWGQPQAAIGELRDVLAETPEQPSATNGRTLLLLARALLAAGRGDDAAESFAEAAATCRRDGNSECTAEAREELAAAHLASGRPREAAGEALQLVTLRRGLDDVPGEVRAHVGLALALRDLDRLEASRDALRTAEALLQEASDGHVAALVGLETARAEARLGNPAEAANRYDDVLPRLAAVADDGASGALGRNPDAETARRERLEVLVDAGLWARALPACARCAGIPGTRTVDLDSLRSAAREQDAVILTWSALDDSVLAWALPPSGRLQGARIRGVGATGLEQLAADVAELAPRLGLPEREPAEGDVPAERYWRALRRLHDVLIAPLRETIPDGVGLLVLPAPPIEGLPFDLLLDADGRSLGERWPVAELPRDAPLPARPPAVSPVKLVADLREPAHPGMDVRRLHAALQGEHRREADEDPARPARRGRDHPGRRRPASSEPASPPGVHAVGENLVFLAGDPGVVEELRQRAPGTGLLVLHAACSQVPDLDLRGALVVLPSCAGSDGERAAVKLLRAGARAVVHPRWDVEPTALEPLVQALVSGVAPAAPVGVAVSAALTGSGRGPERTALRLVGSVR